MFHNFVLYSVDIMFDSVLGFNIVLANNIAYDDVR